MARLAIEGGVYSRQREARKLCMVELRSEPTVHGVTDRTVGGQRQRFVVEHRSLEVLHVTRETLGGEADELPSGGTFVARFTIEAGVSTHQGEAVLVLLY